METIGLFGGTFDPIHLGHLRAAAEVRRKAGLDRVLFIPSYLPPHKASGAVASAEDRLRMVERACRRRPGFEASGIEVEAREKSYSILTLRKVRAQVPRARLFFILGVDAFLDIGTWHQYERVLEECLFIVTGRPGFELDRARDVLGGSLRPAIADFPAGRRAGGRLPAGRRVFLLPIRALEISSTAVRERVRRGLAVEGLVPRPVAAYIRDHKLYRGR
jgi:nicotinate-nucleotide adenylyltransferase